MINTDYGFSSSTSTSSSRECHVTDYALANYCRTASSSNTGYYWSRSASTTLSSAVIVVYYSGYVSTVTATSNVYGIRAALCF